MINQQTITNQFDQIRNLDVRAELKKLDVLDISGNLEKLDLDALDVFDIRKAIENREMPKVDLSMDTLPEPAEVLAKFEEIVKNLVGTAAGFALVTRRELDELETRVAAAEKAAKPAAKKATARKPAAKKATARKPVAKKATASK